MNRQLKHYSACRTYEKSAPRLLELPADDPARRQWALHAAECEGCRKLMEADEMLVGLLVQHPHPGPACVQTRVLAELHSRRRPVIFRRKDFAWGAASGLLGAAMGILISLATPPSAKITTSASQYEANGGVSDSFDQYAADFLAGSEDGI